MSPSLGLSARPLKFLASGQAQRQLKPVLSSLGPLYISQCFWHSSTRSPLKFWVAGRVFAPKQPQPSPLAHSSVTLDPVTTRSDWGGEQWGWDRATSRWLLPITWTRQGAAVPDSLQLGNLPWSQPLSLSLGGEKGKWGIVRY